MNSNQENRVSMYFKVRHFFGAHLPTLAPQVAAFTPVVTDFNSKLLELGLLDQQATEGNQGYTAQKQIDRMDMRDKALVIANGIKSYALINNNYALAGKTATAKSNLDKMRDVDILYFCENMASLANTYAADIIPMGITPAKLSAFEQAVSSYRASLPTPGDQRSESTAAGYGVDNKIIEIDSILNIIDALMETQRMDMPMLYDQYIGERGIDDNAASNTPSDLKIVLEPGFTSIYKIAYNASRQFRLRNNGAAAVNYGISTASDAFDQKVNKLDPQTESTRLSSTLGAAGDHLLVENTSENAVEIELWIIE